MPHRPERLAVRLVTIAAGLVGPTLILAGSASAHVRVFSPEAKPGAPATLQFRVPSEKADATTVQLMVVLPADVKVRSVPSITGWQLGTAAPADDGSSALTWTAEAGHAIQPDSHQYFNVRVGPLPDVPKLAFEAVQTYSDGSVVDWNQPQTTVTEPLYPSPALVLDPAAEPSAGVSVDDGSRPAVIAASSGSSSLDLPSYAISTGLVVVAGGIAWMVRRRVKSGSQC